MVRGNRIEVADAMKLRQPAGDDRSGGRSAESVVQAWTTGGDGEKISVTVCGRSPQLRYPPIVLSGPAGASAGLPFYPAGRAMRDFAAEISQDFRPVTKQRI